MIASRIAHRLFAAALVAVAGATLLLPSSAIAAPGDGWDDPIPLGVSSSVATTFTPTGMWVWCSVEAVRGQTVRIDAETPGASDGGMIIGTYSDPFEVEGAYVAPSLLRLGFMAPRTGSFLLAISSDTTGACSLTTTLTAAQPFSLASLAVPKSARHSKKFTVSVRTYPAYNSLTSPIRFVVERKSGKRYKPFGTALGTFVSESLSGASSKAYAKLSLRKKGTYRVRARFADAAHPAFWSPKWLAVRVN